MSDPQESQTPSNLVCVEYPGVVENVDKMIETLGGIDNVSLVSGEPNRRLELRFRPEDAFSKPTCGERVTHGASSFLLHVAKYKNKATGETKIVPTFCGNVDTNFRFMNLCDFQYLPMSKKETTSGSDDKPTYEDIYDQIYMKKLESYDWLDKGTDAPLFLPPAAFSRMDVSQDYHYRRESTPLGSSDTPYNIIGRTRQRRSHHAIFVTFDVDNIPDKPREVAVNQLRLKFIGADEQQLIKDKFSQVPIWAKNSLHAVTKVPPERLKFILPSLAYYFTTGPWRNQWVKFAYDPRLHRESAQFQTLDYRVRLQGGARHKVKAKRSYANYLLPYKAMSWSKPKTSIISREDLEEAPKGGPSGGKKDSAALKEDEERLKDIYLFRCGRIPPYRQMFYQFKDLIHEEAQELIGRSLSPAHAKCDEKSGWFLPGTDQKLRDLLTRSLNKYITLENIGGGVDASEDEEAISDEEFEDDDEEDDPTLTEINFLHNSSDDESKG